MAEVGLDITGERPRKVTDDMARAPTSSSPWAAATSAPTYPGKRYLDWELADPAGMDLDGVRAVRDEIERRVAGLVDGLAPLA